MGGRRVVAGEEGGVAAGGGGGGGGAEDTYLTRGRHQQPDSQVQQRRLARTVRPDQPDPVPCRETERTLLQCPATAITSSQPGGLDRGRHAAPSEKPFRMAVR